MVLRKLINVFKSMLILYNYFLVIGCVMVLEIMVCLVLEMGLFRWGNFNMFYELNYMNLCCCRSFLY